MEIIFAERHSGRTKQMANWSVGTCKGRYFHFKCLSRVEAQRNVFVKQNKQRI